MSTDLERDLEMVWLLDAWPEPDATVAFMEALMPTMTEPLNRFTAWGEPQRSTKGAWKAEKVEGLLREGYRGDAISYVDVARYRFTKGADNRWPDGAVTVHTEFLRRNEVDDRHPVLVQATRRLVPGETDADAASIALAWSDSAQSLLAPRQGLAMLGVARNMTLFYPQGQVNGNWEMALEDLQPLVDDADTLAPTLQLFDHNVTRVDPFRDARAGTRLRSVRLVQVLLPELADRIRVELEAGLGRVPGAMEERTDRVAWTVLDEAEQARAQAVLVDAGLCIEPVWLPLVGEVGKVWTGGTDDREEPKHQPTKG